VTIARYTNPFYRSKSFRVLAPIRIESWSDVSEPTHCEPACRGWVVEPIASRRNQHRIEEHKKEELSN
jgi:hypothetical protein